MDKEGNEVTFYGLAETLIHTLSKKHDLGFVFRQDVNSDFVTNIAVLRKYRYLGVENKEYDTRFHYHLSLRDQSDSTTYISYDYVYNKNKNIYVTSHTEMLITRNDFSVLFIVAKSTISAEIFNLRTENEKKYLFFKDGDKYYVDDQNLQDDPQYQFNSVKELIYAMISNTEFYFEN